MTNPTFLYYKYFAAFRGRTFKCLKDNQIGKTSLSIELTWVQRNFNDKIEPLTFVALSFFHHPQIIYLFIFSNLEEKIPSV